MDRSTGIFVLTGLLAWIGSITLLPEEQPPIEQPIDFNHKVHVKRVACRECHFRCDSNRDKDGDLDCESCAEAEVPFCAEHAKCPDHKLPGLPRAQDCLRCHREDLVEIKGKPEDELDASQRKKRVLLDYVTVDDAGEATVAAAIPWRRVTRLPASNVYFSHRTHAVVQEIACRVCHADVAESEHPPPRPPLPLSMAMCLQCHEHEGATAECMSCHR